MRLASSFICLIASVASISCAAAADYSAPPLRGMTSFEPSPLYSAPPVLSNQQYVPGLPVYSQWGGFYGGAHFGYGTGTFDFSGATESLISNMLRNTTLQNEQAISRYQVLGKASDSRSSYGGFFGYNQQWEDAVLGVELNYSHGGISAAATPNPIARSVTAGGIGYDVAVNGAAAMKINDLLGIRGRVGWAAGSFLPYASFGALIGRADIMRSASVSGVQGGTTPFAFSMTEAQKDAFVYGWTLGAGLDMMLVQNVFLRAEIEYAHLVQNMGITTSFATGRLGGGLKF